MTGTPTPDQLRDQIALAMAEADGPDVGHDDLADVALSAVAPLLERLSEMLRGMARRSVAWHRHTINAVRGIHRADRDRGADAQALPLHTDRRRVLGD